MSPEKQKIAIATACGWTEIDGLCTRGLIGRPPGKICPFVDYLPDYLGDLNAMHEAEQVLTYEQKEQFIFWLNHLHPSADIHYAEKKRELRLDVFDLVHTTAPQRAEAFLRTLGLWTETPTQPQ
jgi:hypothetical protein